MIGIVFEGDTLTTIRSWDDAVKRLVGYQLHRIQSGLEPSDYKPMKTIGPGVREIRIQHKGQWRVIYIVKTGEAVYVLTAFQKKSQATPKKQIEIARRRLKLIG